MPQSAQPQVCNTDTTLSIHERVINATTTKYKTNLMSTIILELTCRLIPIYYIPIPFHPGDKSATPTFLCGGGGSAENLRF